MKFSQRQAETGTFDGTGLKRIMRGSVTHIAEAVGPFSHDDWRLQKEVHYATIAKAVAGTPVWDVICSALSDLEYAASENPEAYCMPPEIPDTIEEFRVVLIEYALSPWWFETLSLEDIIKASSFQTAMSRGNPRTWPEIHARAVKWRQDVLDGFERYHHNRREAQNARSMMHTWLREFCDKNTDRADRLAEHYRLWLLADRWYETVLFDPGNPTGEAYVLETNSERQEERLREEAREDYDDIVASGFNQYRDPTPPHGELYEKTSVTECYFMSRSMVTEWLQQYEVQYLIEWDKHLRQYDEASRCITRLRVRRPVKYAEEGEHLDAFECEISLDHPDEKLPEGFEEKSRRSQGFGDYRVIKVKGRQFFVPRWRPASELDRPTDRGLVLRNNRDPDNPTAMPKMLTEIVLGIEQDDEDRPVELSAYTRK